MCFVSDFVFLFISNFPQSILQLTLFNFSNESDFAITTTAFVSKYVPLLIKMNVSFKCQVAGRNFFLFDLLEIDLLAL